MTDYVTGALTKLYHPHTLFGPDPIPDENHIGAYVVIYDKTRDEIVTKKGFLLTGQTIVRRSLDRVIKETFRDLTDRNISLPYIREQTFYVYIVTGLTYLADPIGGFKPECGVCFQWGQNYKGIYLPIEIKLLQDKGLHTGDIYDRLVCWECGLPANLWRLPEGLIWRMELKESAQEKDNQSEWQPLQTSTD